MAQAGYAIAGLSGPGSGGLADAGEDKIGMRFRYSHRFNCWHSLQYLRSRHVSNRFFSASDFSASDFSWSACNVCICCGYVFRYISNPN